jgi:hypothetical protein
MPKLATAAMNIARISLSLALPEAPTERLPWSGVWPPRAATEDRPTAPRVHPSIGSSPNRPRTATTNANGVKSTLSNQNKAWLTHSSLVHGLHWH